LLFEPFTRRKTMNARTFGALTGFALLALTNLRAFDARAANDNAEPAGPPHPPREAVEACSNQQEGAACTVSIHGQAISGKCRKGPDGEGPLACMLPPPPEAVAACASLSEGATCTVSHHGRSLEGKCRNSPWGEGPLACVPPPPARR
jgi:hypothetical protein